MSGIVDWLTGASSGADKAAGNVGGYYDAAGNKSNAAYGAAIPQIGAGYDAAQGGINAAYGNMVDPIQAAFNNAKGGSAGAYMGAENNLAGAYGAAGAGLQGAYGAALGGLQGDYTAAENKIMDASGGGAAKTFGDLTAAGLQPQFDKQNSALSARLAAMGIGTSGAGKADYSDLAANQSGTLAGAIAPFYQNAESQYAGLVNAGAGASANLRGAGAGAYGSLLGAGAGAYGNLVGAGAGAASGLESQNAAALQALYGNQAAAGANNFANKASGLGSAYGQQAGAASGIAGQGAGAQGQAWQNTYNSSISDFYNAVGQAGAAYASGGLSGLGGNKSVPSFNMGTGTGDMLPPIAPPPGYDVPMGPGGGQIPQFSMPWFQPQAPIAAPQITQQLAQAPNPYETSYSGGGSSAPNSNPYG